MENNAILLLKALGIDIRSVDKIMFLSSTIVKVVWKDGFSQTFIINTNN